MKIGISANFDKKVAIDSHGGSEVFTYLQATELAKRPEIEKVIVFGVGTSHFKSEKITFVSLLPEETRTFVSTSQLSTLLQSRPDSYTQIEGAMGAKLYAHILPYLKDIDIFHNNSTSGVFNSLISLIDKPVVTTLHTNADSPSIRIPYSLGMFNKLSQHHFVAIANHQSEYIRINNLTLPIKTTIHNGIDTTLNTPLFTTPNTSYGLWIGRISQKHNKGVKEAVQATNLAKKQLKCFVGIDDQAYYHQEVLPLCNENIAINEATISFAEKIKQYQEAAYFIYPIMWEEPFGLVLTEAMACGTPVIAFAKGAVPEIIDDGHTGFIVNSSPTDIRGDYIIKKTGIDGLCEAIVRIHAMSPANYNEMRQNCRNRVLKYFSIEKMIDNYLNLYRDILEQS